MQGPMPHKSTAAHNMESASPVPPITLRKYRSEDVSAHLKGLKSVRFLLVNHENVKLHKRPLDKYESNAYAAAHA